MLRYTHYMNTRKYTHKVVRKGNLYSEHTSEKLANKAVTRLVACSNGRLTKEDFQVSKVTHK